MSEGKFGRLQVGVVIDALEVPAWQFGVIAQIKASACAQLAIALIAARNASTKQEYERAWGGRAYAVYRKLDARRWPCTPHACDTRNAADLLSGVTTLELTVAGTICRDTARSEDLAIDVLLCLGSAGDRQSLAAIARCGAWFYEFGESSPARAPTGFLEVFESRPVTRVALQVMSPHLLRPALARDAYLPTHRLSVGRNANQCRWKAASMLRRPLTRLHRLGATRFLQELDELPAAQVTTTHIRPMGSFAFLKLAATRLARYSLFKLSASLFLDQWILMFGLSDAPTTPDSLRRMMPAATDDWADPFIVREAERYYVFFEELRRGQASAHISVLEMDASGRCSTPVEALAAPYHLSYPFVFQWEDGYYMIPESASNGTIDVYRCDEFPARWRHCKTLMAGVAAADTTLVEHNGKWWLFAAIESVPGTQAWDELHLFYADSPLAVEWTPHPENPVVLDVRSARPAGRIFASAGALYRPAQDCSKGYGYAIRINRIVTLTETAYAEERATSIEPTWDRHIVKTHTFNREGSLTVIDGVLRRFVLARRLYARSHR